MLALLGDVSHSVNRKADQLNAGIFCRRKQKSSAVQKRFLRVNVRVGENEKAVVIVNGVVTGVLSLGEYCFFSIGKKISVKIYDMAELELRCESTEWVERHWDVMQSHLECFVTREGEIGGVYSEDTLLKKMDANQKVFIWKKARQLTFVTTSLLIDSMEGGHDEL